jgi:hypothetical protein
MLFLPIPREQSLMMLHTLVILIVLFYIIFYFYISYLQNFSKYEQMPKQYNHITKTVGAIWCRQRGKFTPESGVQLRPKKWSQLARNFHYEAAPYKNDWDGKPNKSSIGNGKLPVGTYFYFLDLGDEKEEIRKGFVQLEY